MCGQAALSPRLPWPACARLIASTERSIADHSRAISVVQLGSLPISPALMPAASEPRKVVRWLIWPDHTGIDSRSNCARESATAARGWCRNRVAGGSPSP